MRANVAPSHTGSTVALVSRILIAAPRTSVSREITSKSLVMISLICIDSTSLQSARSANDVPAPQCVKRDASCCSSQGPDIIFGTQRLTERVQCQDMERKMIGILISVSLATKEGEYKHQPYTSWPKN